MTRPAAIRRRRAPEAAGRAQSPFGATVRFQGRPVVVEGRKTVGPSAGDAPKNISPRSSLRRNVTPESRASPAQSRRQKDGPATRACQAPSRLDQQTDTGNPSTRRNRRPLAAPFSSACHVCHAVAAALARMNCSSQFGIEGRVPIQRRTSSAYVSSVGRVTTHRPLVNSAHKERASCCNTSCCPLSSNTEQRAARATRLAGIPARGRDPIFSSSP